MTQVGENYDLFPETLFENNAQRMLKCLQEVHRILNSDCPAIVDTIWYLDCETLSDYVQNTIEAVTEREMP